MPKVMLATEILTVRAVVCSCGTPLFQVGVIRAESPYQCVGCNRELEKGIVLRCPNCGSVSCADCIEREMAASVAAQASDLKTLS